eukprot:scaffold872_cov421-Prasinococcus_capsulatus_cf.AAC.12
MRYVEYGPTQDIHGAAERHSSTFLCGLSELYLRPRLANAGFITRLRTLTDAVLPQRRSVHFSGVRGCASMWRLERLLAIVLSIVLVFTCARVCQGAAKQKSELSYAERVEMRKRYRPKYARSWEDACGEHELAPSPSGGTVQYGNKPVCLWIWADETNSTEAQRILERRKHSWLWMEEKDTNKAGSYPPPHQPSSD